MCSRGFPDSFVKRIDGILPNWRGTTLYCSYLLCVYLSIIIILRTIGSLLIQNFQEIVKNSYFMQITKPRCSWFDISSYYGRSIWFLKQGGRGVDGVDTTRNVFPSSTQVKIWRNIAKANKSKMLLFS